MLSGLRQDLVLARRQIRRQPGFALLVVLTLGSAIGVNTSLFTAFNTFALQPWPVDEPDRLVRIRSTSDATARGMSVAEWRHVSAATRSFSGLAARIYQNRVRLGDGRELGAAGVTANYFDVLKVPIEHGRGFLPHEGHDNSPGDVAVLGYGAWQRLFGGDPAAVGRTLEIDGLRFEVVGVASRRLFGITRRAVDVWLPPTAQARWSPDSLKRRNYLTDPRATGNDVVARLAPGVSAEAAQIELEALTQEFRRGFDLPPGRFVVRPTTRGSTWQETRRLFAPFALLTLAVALVLLLACANVGNLLLARSYARRQEIAVRLSLGAGRGRIVRQLLTEAFALAALAAVLGIGIASVLPAAVAHTVPDARDWRFPLDHRVLVYAVGLSTLACVAFGLAPALHCTRASVSAALKDAYGLPVNRLSLRSVLLSTQVALCVVLLVGAGLMTRGLTHAVRQDLGYDPSGVSVVSFDAPVRTKQQDRVAAFNAQLATELPALGSQEQLAATETVPFDQVGVRFKLEGEAGELKRHSVAQFVTPAYFDLLRIPIVAGRPLGPADSFGQAVVVSESFARRFWPGETPLGRRVVCGFGSPEVVGVARDALLSELEEIEPTVYLVRSGRQRLTRVLVRDEGDGLARAVVAVAARIDPDLRPTVTPLSARIDEELRLSRLGARVAAGIGVLALALATMGLAGVFAYSVQQRTRELGIRIALGAGTRHVLAAVLSTAGRALVAGLGLGFTSAVAGSYLLRQLLYGLSPLDPVTYVSVGLVLVAAGLVATCLPARRAMRVSPTVALRYE